ncbi:MAG: peroxiredoxin-like family protein [Planctomycetota bacterium]
MIRNAAAVALAAGVLASGSLVLTGCATGSVSHGASESGLGLAEGVRAPNATVRDTEGGSVRLASLYGDGPVVVTFYRGSWCPYCNNALTEWQGKLDDLEAAGGRLVALTPDKPENAAGTVGKHDLGFTVLSDADFEAADAFGVRFSLDADTREKYKGYGIDLAKSNASGDWDLPHPGTFVIDSSGVIRYAWVSSDYATRANPDEVIAAVRDAS